MSLKIHWSFSDEKMSELVRCACRGLRTCRQTQPAGGGLGHTLPHGRAAPQACPPGWAAGATPGARWSSSTAHY